MPLADGAGVQNTLVFAHLQRVPDCRKRTLHPRDQGVWLLVSNIEYSSVPSIVSKLVRFLRWVNTSKQLLALKANCFVLLVTPPFLGQHLDACNGYKFIDPWAVRLTHSAEIWGSTFQVFDAKPGLPVVFVQQTTGIPPGMMVTTSWQVKRHLRKAAGDWLPCESTNELSMAYLVISQTKWVSDSRFSVWALDTRITRMYPLPWNCWLLSLFHLNSQVNSLRVTSAVSDFGGERTPPEPGEGVML